MDALRILLNAALVVGSLIVAVLLWKLYRHLETWYREDPGRYWLAPDRKRAFAGLRVVLALGVVLFGGMALFLVEPWAFAPVALVLSCLFFFAFQAWSPRRDAFNEIQRNPGRYPVPETPLAGQRRTALRILLGMAIFIGALIAFAVYFAATAF